MVAGRRSVERRPAACFTWLVIGLRCVEVRQAPEGSPLECDLLLAGRGESARMQASARSYNQVSRAATTVVWLTGAS